MKKIFFLIPIVIIAIILTSMMTYNENIPNEQQNITTQNTDTKIENKVIMPTKSSRPGCEETNSCYIPSDISISIDDTVTWINEDAAFHSVTSGYYGEPDGIFDSGHLDPNEIFTWTFTLEGNYDYYCELHPWMDGTVIVR